MAPPWQMPKTRRRLPGGLTGNALVAGVVSAIVAGVISFYVAHWQSHDAAKQAISAQQATAAVQLEAAATTFYQDTNGLYDGRTFDCTEPSRNTCMLTVPSNNAFVDDEDALDADRMNISDPKASALALRLFGSAQNLLLSVGGSLRAQNTYEDQMTEAYDELMTRCGQLVQGG